MCDLLDEVLWAPERCLSICLVDSTFYMPQFYRFRGLRELICSFLNRSSVLGAGGILMSGLISCSVRVNWIGRFISVTAIVL